MATINVRLSEKSISDAIAYLESYERKVRKAASETVKVAVEMGTEQAKEEAKFMDAYDTGELVRGIKGERSGNEGRIVSTAPHSVFVEMGTGARALREPNPGNYLPGWQYDVNNHGDEGWWYTGDDGKRHWTKGMPSRPYMYYTANVLRDSIPWIVEGVLKDS